MEQIRGKQSIEFEKPPFIEAFACVAGSKESEGPLAERIDEICSDDLFGGKAWEEAESNMQKRAVEILFAKSGDKPADVRYIFAGDLLNQLTATSYGVMSFDIPLFGLYGACSTMGESIALAAMTVAAGYAKKVIALASSHYASAEKQFRFPMEYGNQRPLAASWTVTGCGTVQLGKRKSDVCVKGITTGKVVDFGVHDSMNMGACMAPAAAELIYQNFMDFGVDATHYDKIITGDLGNVGKTILLDLLRDKGFDISTRYTDCGLEIYYPTQDVHAGGSGCGCSAVTLCAHIMQEMIKGQWKRVLFVPTGALHSPTSYNEGKAVPGIAHGIILERTW